MVLQYNAFLNQDKLQPSTDNGSRFDVFRAIIDEIMILAKEKDMTVLFVWVPSIKHFEDDSADFAGDSESKVFGEVKKAINGTSAPFINAKTALSRDDYYVYDGHLKPIGNRKIAELISEYILKR